MSYPLCRAGALPKLELLNLSQNSLSSATATAFAAAARQGAVQGLTHLYLGGNAVGDEGGAALANALKLSECAARVAVQEDALGAGVPVGLGEPSLSRRQWDSQI